VLEVCHIFIKTLAETLLNYLTCLYFSSIHSFITRKLKRKLKIRTELGLDFQGLLT